MPEPINNGEENRQTPSGQPNHEPTQEEKEAEELILSVDPDNLEDLDAEQLQKLAKAVKKSKEFVSQKNHWKDKYSSVETKLKELQPPATPKEETKKQEQQQNVDSSRFEKLEFRQEHRDLTSEEVEEIFAYAKARGIKPEEALEKPVIKSFLKENKTKKDSEDASPRPSGRGGATPSGAKDYSRMSHEEVQKHREEIMRRHRNS